jgi:hypothetical protein
MMVDTWAVYLLALTLIGCASYITYLLREVKLYQEDVAVLTTVLQMASQQLKQDMEEDNETRH